MADMKSGKHRTDDLNRFRMRIAFRILCLLGAVFQIWLLWGSELPLGVPGEWTWSRLKLTDSFWLDLPPAFITGGLLIGYFGLTWEKTPANRPYQSFFWLTGLFVLGLVWLFSANAANPAGGGLGRSVFVVFYPRTSGYFHQALFDAEDAQEFLSGYSERISDDSNPENYLHLGTHPPGLTMFYRSLIELCQQSPGLVELLKSIQPSSVSSAIAAIQRQLQRDGKVFSDAAAAALWLSVLISFACAAATIFPLYLLVRRIASPQTAGFIAVLWLFVPAMILFLPKSDAAFPLFAMLLQWLWLMSLEKNSPLWGGLTALLFVFAASLSLAFFTVGAILFFQTIYAICMHKRGMRPLLAGIVVGSLLLLLIAFLTDLNLLKIWWQNLHNHGQFYTHNVRTYWNWLGVNLLEGACSVGMPIAICGLVGLVRVRKEMTENYWLFIACAVWALLWLSGKNMGEAARLWIFLMPYCVLSIAPVIDQIFQKSQQSLARLFMLGIALLQLIVCMATVTRIDSFGFTEL